MKTLSYYPEACEDPEDFVTHYKDFDCPLIFPALKTLDYAGPNSSGFQFTHFVYDVENMVFKEICFSSRGSSLNAVLHFRDDIPSKTPLLSSDQEVTHESQFKDLLNANIRSLFDFIQQFAYLDAIDLEPNSLGQEKFVELLLTLKDIRSLSFDIEYQDFSSDLCKETFKATTVFLKVHESKLPSVLDWLASCFPNLVELGIYLSYDPAKYDGTKKSESKSIFEFWEKLIGNRPNLSKIHLPNAVFSRWQIEKKYPHILVGNKCKATYLDTQDDF
ncbi:hypothetical protein DSO57_1007395 [Entomophthora muscae]|uniref:Uncharacterized protein n=1 Tax=Entomophthora muscae TaxID=34485 RepID=A0ACC2TUL2_9FUNG|nr:hypothetical protein DSO57_1007395 [Entomophthora muscae]